MLVSCTAGSPSVEIIHTCCVKWRTGSASAHLVKQLELLNQIHAPRPSTNVQQIDHLTIADSDNNIAP